MRLPASHHARQEGIRTSSWAAAFWFGFYELGLKNKCQIVSVSCLELLGAPFLSAQLTSLLSPGPSAAACSPGKPSRLCRLLRGLSGHPPHLWLPLSSQPFPTSVRHPSRSSACPQPAIPLVCASLREGSGHTSRRDAVVADSLNRQRLGSSGALVWREARPERVVQCRGGKGTGRRAQHLALGRRTHGPRQNCCPRWVHDLFSSFS